MSGKFLVAAGTSALAVVGAGLFYYNNQKQLKKKLSESSGKILSDSEFIEALKTVKLSEKTIKIVKATAPVVGEHAVEITSAFYPLMFKNNPEALYYFNKANQNKGMQQEALAHAVVAYASNIDNLEAVVPLLKVIAERHCALSVTADLYAIVYKNLMLAIAKVLADALTPEIVDAWSEAVVFLSKACIDTEAGLYKTLEARSGGWKGERKFVLKSKVKVADDTVQFEFVPTTGEEGIAFTAGQYLTIRCPNLSPRHYTITSASGSKSLMCTTRLVSGGEVSTYMHKQLKVGDEVLLGAPCGLFSPEEGESISLISAGIGITPMYSFLKAVDSKSVKSILHFETSDKRMAFKTEFTEAKANIVYTEGKDRKTLIQENAKRIVSKSGSECTYYLCGPKEFMSEMTKALKSNGAKNINSEVFGTGTAPVVHCPMSL
mmetsp:Transcript_9501/g.11398  ORF Transcript_9501/g.11398 Transcript_9501/m.11398 type:complete len:434 (+) Transcript_9501:287-1588(+)